MTEKKEPKKVTIQIFTFVLILLFVFSIGGVVGSQATLTQCNKACNEALQEELGKARPNVTMMAEDMQYVDIYNSAEDLT